MSQLQPSSNSEQVLSDLIQRLRYAFSEGTNSSEVSLNEFKSILNRVFAGASTAKLEQIFVSFDEESTGTINWYSFLKAEQLSRVLLSLHDDSISQISLLQRSSNASFETAGSTDSQSFNDNTSSLGQTSVPPGLNGPGVLSPIASQTASATALDAAHDIHAWPRTLSAPSLEQRSSHESLEQEVQEKQAEIQKLKAWITDKGLPAQSSASQFEQKAKKHKQRESEMVEEIKRSQDLNDSLKAQNLALQKEHNQLHSQHTALKNEHMSFKILCNEIQRKYDECLELYRKEKEHIKSLTEVNQNLNKLKQQYDRVNSDQNTKIQSYKQKTDDLREKCGILEMYIGEIVAENEGLQQLLKAYAEETDTPPEVSRIRALSAVNENSESSIPKLKVDVSSEDHPQPKHRAFQPSHTIKVSNFEDIARRYSSASIGGSGALGRNRRGSSLLMRIRSSKQIGADTPPTSAPEISGFPAYENDSLTLDDQRHSASDPSGGYNFRRRKRTVSILSIGGLMTPRGKKFQTLNESIGHSGAYSGVLKDSIDMDMDADGVGYADAAYEEWGDVNDLDQLTEITEQLRVEIQEEMEEELEAQIENKYDLKILKLNTAHNEQLMLLNVEIDRLKGACKRQLRQIRVLEGGGSVNRNMEPLRFVDDQKTNEEEERIKMDDDMDRMSIGDSDDTYDDGSGSDSSAEDGRYGKRREEYRKSDDSEDDRPLLDEASDGDRKHRKRHKKKKAKHKKKEKKRKKLMQKKASNDMAGGRFCCSSLWKDYAKIYDGEDDVASSDHEVSSKSSRRKDKKKKKKDKEKKKKSKRKKKKKKKKKKGEDEKQRRSKKQSMV